MSAAARGHATVWSQGPWIHDAALGASGVEEPSAPCLLRKRAVRPWAMLDAILLEGDLGDLGDLGDDRRPELGGVLCVGDRRPE